MTPVLKPMQALGLAMIIVGGMVILGISGLRPLGGALAICGAALLVYSWLNGRRRPPAPASRKPYKWDDDEPSPAQTVYRPTPGVVRLRERPSDGPPVFTEPSPGAIPSPRESTPAPGGPAYTTGRADIPARRERTRGEAEYTVPTPDRALDRGKVPPPLTASPRPADPAADHDPYLPPMAPPPPG